MAVETLEVGVLGPQGVHLLQVQPDLVLEEQVGPQQVVEEVLVLLQRQLAEFEET